MLKSVLKKRMNINIPAVHSVNNFNVIGLCGKRKKSQFAWMGHFEQLISSILWKKHRNAQQNMCLKNIKIFDDD